MSPTTLLRLYVLCCHGITRHVFYTEEAELYIERRILAAGYAQWEKAVSAGDVNAARAARRWTVEVARELTELEYEYYRAVEVKKVAEMVV